MHLRKAKLLGLFLHAGLACRKCQACTPVRDLSVRVQLRLRMQVQTHCFDVNPVLAPTAALTRRHNPSKAKSDPVPLRMRSCRFWILHVHIMGSEGNGTI